MPTSASVIPEELFVQKPINVEPGLDLQLSVDVIMAFGPGGTLEVEGAADAARITFFLARKFGRPNALAVIDAHVPGSAHAHGAYRQEAGIVPNVTTLSEDIIARWIQIGEDRILKSHARFSLRSLRTEARLTRMFTGADQIVWAQHALMGGAETQFISSIWPELFSNIFFKGTHPVHDSHSGIWDAVGNPVGVMAEIASRPKQVRAVYIDGNALEVCIYLTGLNLARFGIQVYLVVDAIGFLPFIDGTSRQVLIQNLLHAGVKFVHSTQLQFN